MPYYMYVSLQDDDKVLVFTMDAGTGKLTPKAEVPVSGGPSALTLSPDRNALYVGCRGTPGISSFRIDHDTGGLRQSGTVSLGVDPTFLSTDRKGKFVLSASYQGAQVAVHAISDDGAVVGPPVQKLATATGAHAIQTDPSNKFAFVPTSPGGDPTRYFSSGSTKRRATLPPTHRQGSSRKNTLVPATIAFIQPKTSSTFPMSRAAV